MRLIYIIGFALGSIVSNAQIRLLPFSAVSGMETTHAELTNIPGGYLMNISSRILDSGSVKYIHYLYRINSQGVVVDSFDLQFGNRDYTGRPFVDSKGRLYFLGFYISSDSYYSQRYSGIKLDSNLNAVQVFDFPVFPNFRRSVGIVRGYSGEGISGFSADFVVHNDTFYTSGNYLIVESPLVILGAEHHYFKGTLDGRVLLERQLTADAHISFFRGNQLYVMGYIGEPFSGQQYDVARYDQNGQFV
ncbi:MAG: hypothetical protein NZM43_13585, partial [Saprospiraceae bacterium]|nr:hypothetical protein [Saprospiraceae bacterium]MDW8485346.1 hypothetical protein [Saprospiraceae bacterium]